MVSNFINGVLKRAKSDKLDLSDKVVDNQPQKQAVPASEAKNKDIAELGGQNQSVSAPVSEQSVQNNVGQTTTQASIPTDQQPAAETFAATPQYTPEGIPPNTTESVLEKASSSKTSKKDKPPKKPKKDKKPLFSNFSLNSAKGWMIAAIVNFLLFALTLGFFLFGFDEKFFKCSLEGFVVNSQSSALSGAEVSFQDKEVLTDANGKFVIDKVEKGTFSITIEAKNYKILETEVKIDKIGVNEEKFVLDNQKYTNLSGQLQFEGGEINPSDFTLSIDEESVTVGKDGKFSLESVEIKKVSVVLTSQVYKDISLDYDLEVGQQNVINGLSLIPAQDFNVTTKDWLTGEIVDGVTITYNGKEYISNQEGLVSLKDVEIDKAVLIEAQKENYEEFSEEIDFDGQDRDLFIVPQNEILYTASIDDESSLYKAALDGSNSEQLFEDEGNISQVYESQDNIFFVSDKSNQEDDDNDQIYSYSKETQEVEKVSNIAAGDTDSEGRKISRKFDFAHERIISYHKHETDHTKRAYLEASSFDGEDVQVLYNSRPSSGIKRIIKTPVLSQDGNQAAFVVSDYSISSNRHVQSVAYIITDLNDRGSIRSMYTTTSSSADVKILGVPEGNKLSLIVDDENGKDVILVIGLQTRNVEKKTLDFVVSQDSSNLIGNDLYILSSGENGGDLYTFNPQSLQLSKLTESGEINEYIIDENKGLIFYRIGEKLSISDFQKPQFIRKTDIETNFAMW